ncbi:MFS transporter [Sphingomonas sp. CL5.1]|uniref:MFS transporter n=1 Tax=Sphingomonas sp. CL5.1 TaxID=2653203 RepID=UPI0015824C63|nr:MFS transporter [Sphingomonas sp. CL5.1]QKR99926.1 MFS transporter [Sphingomonas sp. CL5.1]
MPGIGLIKHSDHLPLVVAAIFFIQNLDGSILNTSLPQVAGSFRASAVDINAGITSYFISAAALMPLSGWFAQRFGVRKTLISAMIVFTVASVLCGLARSLPQFVVARIIQGAGAALLTPVGRIAVLKNTTKPDLLRAISMLTWPALLAPVAGPWLGGAITSWVGWRLNFFVNVPLGLTCMLLIMAVVPRGEADARTQLDIRGALLISSSLGLAMYGLDWLTNTEARGVLVGGTLLSAGIMLGWGALLWLRRTPAPLIDPAILSIGTFAFSTFGGANLIKIAIAVTPYLLPLLVQIVWGMSPIDAGMVMLFYFLGNLSMKTATTPVIRQLGFRAAMIGSGAVVALSTAALPLFDWHHLTVPSCFLLLIAGASRSLFFTAANTLSFSDVPQTLTASASTFASMMQQVSLAVGVGLAALSLSLANAAGSVPTLDRSDFVAAFLFSAFLALCGVMLTLRLSGDAGNDVRAKNARR